jgi:hypothetical protein
MSARVEAQAPSTLRPWATPWIAALVALLVALGTLVWTLTRNSGPATQTHQGPAVSTATHEDSSGRGLVNTGGVTRPIPYQPVAPAIGSTTPAEEPVGGGLANTGGVTRPIPYQPVGGVDPAAAAAPAAAQPASAWYFHMVSTGGETHPAPSI